MRWLRRCGFLLIGTSTGTAAQTVGRDQYYTQLPGMSRLVSATRANIVFQLFGDTAAAGYRDANLDGIDDSRAALLHGLAERFAPVMRRNNFSVPRDFQQALADRWLHVDVWRGDQRMRADSLKLGGPGEALGSNSAAGADSDARLVQLLREYSPLTGESRHVPADIDSTVVLFLDFPGSNERSWRAAYHAENDVHAYVHPFIATLAAAPEPRYALVMQYWFFYPFNDGTNNHEGDWEHINVVVTTRAHAGASHADAAGLTAEEVTSILSGATPGTELMIAAVEYYFHENYTVLDYVASQERARMKAAGSAPSLHIWVEPDYIDDAIGHRLRQEQLATHPIVFIGGNNRGPDELTSFWPRFRAGFNRNGHGSYPFPGIWQAVGPLSSTEQLSGRRVPVLRGNEEFQDTHFMWLRAQDLTLVPDWERVVDLTLEHQDARWRWAWLILPIRWGFPASVSPGGTLLKHTDLGQIAPEGPAFQPTWNRLARHTGWREYQTQVLRVLMVPVNPWAQMRNGLGVLNVPIAFLGIMPGWSVVVSQALPWVTGTMQLFGAPPPKTYYPGEPPFRFTSFGGGLALTTRGERFARLLPAGSDSASLVAAREGGTSFSGTMQNAATQRLWLNLFYGRAISVENTLSRISAVLMQEPQSPGGSFASGRLDLLELTGGIRLNAWKTNDDALQLYARTGYGYTWYDLANVSVDGRPVPGFQRKGGYSPTLWPSARWWPNTAYLGAGIEVFTPKRFWLLSTIGLGVRAETTSLWHRLGARRPGIEHLGWDRRADYAVSVLAAW
ncbi:MAG: hypothetical protein ACRENP_12735 [Longimicrobiales bacterium]